MQLMALAMSRLPSAGVRTTCAFMSVPLIIMHEIGALNKKVAKVGCPAAE
jgi:hypothetical protein